MGKSYITKKNIGKIKSKNIRLGKKKNSKKRKKQNNKKQKVLKQSGGATAQRAPVLEEMGCMDAIWYMRERIEYHRSNKDLDYFKRIITRVGKRVNQGLVKQNLIKMLFTDTYIPPIIKNTKNEDYIDIKLRLLSAILEELERKIQILTKLKDVELSIYQDSIGDLIEYLIKKKESYTRRFDEIIIEFIDYVKNNDISELSL